MNHLRAAPIQYSKLFTTPRLPGRTRTRRRWEVSSLFFFPARVCIEKKKKKKERRITVDSLQMIVSVNDDDDDKLLIYIKP